MRAAYHSISGAHFERGPVWPYDCGMRSFVVAAALFICACGDVVKVPDAGTPDTYVPDSPTSLSCGAGEMACNGSCANVMTSELYCGNCNTQCTPTFGCLNGACVPANTSCQRVRELEPSAPDGLYTSPNNGVTFYCDFTNNMTYESFSIAQYNVTYPNHTFMTSAHFNDPAIQKAFVALYNAQGGLINISVGFNATNCCFKAADAPANQMLNLGASYIYPAKVGTDQSQCGGPYNDVRYRLYLQQPTPPEYSPLPMPDNWLATHPATIVMVCGDSTTGGNPGIFMRRRTGLN
jgi:hypothetical protein